MYHTSSLQNQNVSKCVKILKYENIQTFQIDYLSTFLTSGGTMVKTSTRWTKFICSWGFQHKHCWTIFLEISGSVYIPPVVLNYDGLVESHLQMNNDIMHSLDFSPHMFLHWKQIYRLKKTEGRQGFSPWGIEQVYLSLTWHKGCTQECIDIILLKTVWESDHKQPKEVVILFQNTPCDPAVIGAILPRS